MAAKDNTRTRAVPVQPRTAPEWAAQESRSRGAAQSLTLPLWVLLVVPLFLGLVLFVSRSGARPIAGFFVVCAVVVGFYLAGRNADSVTGTLARGILYTVGAIVVFLVLAVGLLFLGCLALA